MPSNGFEECREQRRGTNESKAIVVRMNRATTFHSSPKIHIRSEQFFIYHSIIDVIERASERMAGGATFNGRTQSMLYTLIKINVYGKSKMQILSEYERWLNGIGAQPLHLNSSKTIKHRSIYATQTTCNCVCVCVGILCMEHIHICALGKYLKNMYTKSFRLTILHRALYSSLPSV